MKCVNVPTVKVFDYQDHVIVFYSPLATSNFFYDGRFCKSHFFVSKDYARGFISKIGRSYSSVTSGHFSILHVKGIGFKVYYHSVNHSLYFLLGYNHVTKLTLPFGIRVKVRKQYILLFSPDSSLLGRYNFLIRSLRAPDPYRGKGIRYRYQIMNFKPGKQR